MQECDQFSNQRLNNSCCHQPAAWYRSLNLPTGPSPEREPTVSSVYNPVFLFHNKMLTENFTPVLFYWKDISI